MRAFCTIFDKNYLYQGVALYNSLVRFGGNFKLYTLCMDSTSYEMMMKMKSANLVPVSVDKLITPEISKVRDYTSHGQFCWVCQPIICEYLLDNFEHEMVTYIDADTMFFSNPEILFKELGDGSVSLVPHNFSPGFDLSENVGKFCVQFNAFRNDSNGRKILEFWRLSCFKYNKNEPLLVPGQTCLDEWTEGFEGVKVIQHPGAGVAPWNIQRYSFETGNSVPYVDGVPVVFYHFHQYGRYENGDHDLGGYPLSVRVVNSIYKTYINEIAAAEKTVKSIDKTFDFRRYYRNYTTFMDVIKFPARQNISKYLKVCKRRIRGRYNVFPDGYFR